MRYGQKLTRIDLNFFNRYDSIFALEVVVVFQIINPKWVEKNITFSEIVETMSFTIFFYTINNVRYRKNTCNF